MGPLTYVYELAKLLKEKPELYSQLDGILTTVFLILLLIVGYAVIKTVLQFFIRPKCFRCMRDTRKIIAENSVLIGQVQEYLRSRT